MTKRDYIFKRKCLLLCANALKNLRSSSKDIIHEQMIRMNKELEAFHKSNTKKAKRVKR